MLKLLRTLAASIRTPKTAAGRNPRRFAPQVEALHDRLTPSATVAGGHLIIYGTSGDDVVSVSQNGSSYRVSELVSNAYMGRTKITDIPVANVTGQISF